MDPRPKLRCEEWQEKRVGNSARRRDKGGFLGGCYDNVVKDGINVDKVGSTNRGEEKEGKGRGVTRVTTALKATV